MIFSLVNVFWNFMVMCIYFSPVFERGHSLGIQMTFSALETHVFWFWEKFWEYFFDDFLPYFLLFLSEILVWILGPLIL